MREVVGGGGDHVVLQESLLLNTITSLTGDWRQCPHVRVLHTPLAGLGGQEPQVGPGRL